jgi:putative oxidoreductase
MQKFTVWAESRRDLWLDLVRIYLGLGLLARGLLLITNTSTSYMVDMLQRSGVSWLTTGLMLHYVMLAHFVGGLLLTVGFLNPICARVEFTIIAGALFIIE